MGLRQLKKQLRTQAEPLPDIMFDNRHIFIESRGPLDKNAPKVAKALSEVLRNMLGSRGVGQGPLIETPVVIGGNGDGE